MRRCPAELQDLQNFRYIFGPHVRVSFASVENLVMSVTEKSFEERAATVFERKRRQTAAMLIINFSTN